MSYLYFFRFQSNMAYDLLSNFLSACSLLLFLQLFIWRDWEILHEFFKAVLFRVGSSKQDKQDPFKVNLLQSSIYERLPQFMQSIWHSKVCSYPTLSSIIVKLNFFPTEFCHSNFWFIMCKKEIVIKLPS